MSERYVAPLLSKPANEDDYDALVEALDELLNIVGDDDLDVRKVRAGIQIAQFFAATRRLDLSY